MADLTTRNRTKDTLISDRFIYSQMLCQLSYGEPEGMNLTCQITVYKSEKLSESAFKCERMPLHAEDCLHSIVRAITHGGCNTRRLECVPSSQRKEGLYVQYDGAFVVWAL